MMRSVSIACALATGFLCHGPLHAEDSAADVARRCAERVNQIVKRCDEASRTETVTCVATIRRLLEAGRREAAEQVARECIEAAHRRTRHCSEEIREICARCIRWLNEKGETELAGRLRSHCAESLQHLRTSLTRQVNIIRHALRE